MPLITARTREGHRSLVKLPSGHTVCSAFAVNTDEGWIDMYVVSDKLEDRPVNPGEPKLPVDRVLVDKIKGGLVTVRVHTDFDIVDRFTNTVTYSVRHPLG